LFASSNEEEVRLESSQTSSALVELRSIESLQKKIDERVWEMRWEKGKVEAPKTSGGSPHGHWNWRVRFVDVRSTDGEFLWFGAVSGGEGKEGRGRSLWAI
jgi:hypothetical protein